jgi:transposase-like protein
LNHFTHGRFGLDRQSITRDVYTKRKRLFNILLPFSLLIPGTPSDQAKYYQNTWLLLLNILGFRIMRSVHHLQIILKERLNPYAKAVNFTFDNSNIR